MEFEFIALNKVGEDVEWIRKFFEDISCQLNFVHTIGIHCDDQLAIERAQNSVYNSKFRHYD